MRENDYCKCNHKYHNHDMHEGRCFVKGCKCKKFEPRDEKVSRGFRYRM